VVGADVRSSRTRRTVTCTCDAPGKSVQNTPTNRVILFLENQKIKSSFSIQGFDCIKDLETTKRIQIILDSLYLFGEKVFDIQEALGGQLDKPRL
jgi:hypothetical protein